MKITKIVKGARAVLPTEDGFWAVQTAPVNGLVITKDGDTRGINSIFITEAELKEAGYNKRRVRRARKK